MFEMNRNAKLWLVTAADLLSGTYDTEANVAAAMKANVVPGVTAFGYDHEFNVQRRGAGQFGKNKPVGITDEYNGIKGSFDVEGFDGDKAATAALMGKTTAALVNTNYNRLLNFFVLCNTEDDSGNALNAHLCLDCKLDGVPKNVSGDAKRFSFQGVEAVDFPGHRLKFVVISGNDTTPVTAASFVGTAVKWQDETKSDRYAALVLRTDGTTKGTKKLQLATAAAAGYYAETSSGITLHADDGLRAADRLLVAYITK